MRNNDNKSSLTPKLTPKPGWLKKSLPKGGDYQKVRNLLAGAKLHTVCQEANCPNMFECFSKQTATFMILGDVCTRNCRFCNIVNRPALPVDPDEPLRVAKTAQDLKLKYVVVTSVTRDDLDDGGAAHFVHTIKALKAISSISCPTRVEVLIPDFKGNIEALKTIVYAKPDVLNHNIETVPSLYPTARPQADYDQSLELLDNVKSINSLTDFAIPIKSGIMVGLGETMDELEQTMKDLFSHGCNILTIGQYLQPTKDHLKVKKYYSPEAFKIIEDRAKDVGFKKIAAGPFVRSSYNAGELFFK
jgi:lipoyl synthase